MSDDITITKGKIFKWGFFAILIFVGLGFIGTWMGVIGNIATAPARVINKTLETNNIIQSYEWFYDTNAAYIARANQVKQFDGLLKSEESADERKYLRIDLAAMQQTCRDLVTKYNANSAKMNKSIFKGWDLPGNLSINQCEVNV